jgi:hypothetical protein
MFKQSTSPVTYVILGILLVGLVLLIILGNAMGGGSQDKSGRRYSKWGFRREAYKLGLTKDQVDLLINLIRIYHVNRPFDLLSNSRTLNNTLGKALRDIGAMQAPSGIVEKQKLDLYKVKQLMERIDVQTNRLDNTKNLSLGQKITFKMPNNDRIQTVVTANVKEFFCAKVPVNAGGEQIRWKKGSKQLILLWGKDGEEQGFETKVLGYNNVKGVTSVLLQHTGQINKAYHRRFRRKKIRINCHAYPIQIIITGKGRRAKKEAMVMNNAGRMMSMTDISSGGCCLQTGNRMPRGELVKLNFEPVKGKPVVALGKIVDVRKSAGPYLSVHVMFTKASSQNLNRINEYVYDFQ